VWPPGDGPDVVGQLRRLEQGDEHAEEAAHDQAQQHQHHAPSDANATNSNLATGSSASDRQQACSSVPGGF
jgi:hypothetical protein